jgi:beta-apo-4'-carotenal oxygenase
VLLNEKWDKIFYTGNATVGTIIARKAAETLTPVALEMGGRNPAIVTKNTDIRLAARRLLWGKFLNAGQACISQNYTMVDAEVADDFVEQLRVAMNEFYPQGAKASPDFARIVSAHHFARIKKMLDATQGKIVIGGATDADDLYIEPTVVIVKDEHDSLITDESFGPLLPVLPVANLDDAIRIANAVHRTPLGLYAFGNKEEVERILMGTTSGGATIGDALFHASIPTMPFGGVGNSGQGAYRGKASFDVFTHRRPITRTPGWMEKLLAVRYPPYAGKVRFSPFPIPFSHISPLFPLFITHPHSRHLVRGLDGCGIGRIAPTNPAKLTTSQLKRITTTSALTPNFDRQLRTKYGLTYYLRAALLLGGGGVKEGFARWVLLVLVAAMAKKGWEGRSGLPSYLR